jgi:4-hydroxy-tetrahydrodipicolinate synthase
VSLAREAASAGAAGVLLMPPYFFRYDQQDVREFYLQFAAQVGTAVPIYLYNIPFFTSELAVETAAELLETGLFAGIKDSSGKFEYFERLRTLRETRPFTLLVGNDVVFARARAAGADGVVSGCACAVPELLLGLDSAILASDVPRVDTLSRRLEEFIAWLDRFPTPVGVRAATLWRGVKTGGFGVPLPPAKARALVEFKEWFEGWLPAMRREACAA